MSKTRHTAKWSLNLHEMVFGVKRYYVHGGIVLWLKEILTPLCEEGTVTIVDIYHTPIYDGVNCIEFYSDIFSSDGHTKLGVIFDDIRKLLVYKMPWVSDTTYFIEIDTDFNQHLKKVIELLKVARLWQNLETTYEMRINWFQIKKIQVLQFKNDIDIKASNKIGQIFRIVSEYFKRSRELYIANPLPWHADKYSFRPMDTLCWEICGEVWKRYGLLDDFSMRDLLAIDMANKDFRDPYFDRYIDDYVNLLIEPKLSFSTAANDSTKVECLIDNSLDCLWSAGYFMHKYRDKMSTVILPEFYWDPERHKLKDIFNFKTEYNQNKYIKLCGHNPDPNTLRPFETKYRQIRYTIENYRYFSDEVFQKLISLPKNSQRIAFNLTKKFDFLIPDDVEPIPKSNRFIEISIISCSVKNTNKMENFVRYLIKLFKNYKMSNINFDECKFNDYTPFKNVGDSFGTVQFNQMQFTKHELAQFLPFINSKTKLKFWYCRTFSDANMLQVCTSKNVNPKNVTVYQEHACTWLALFMLAEYFMVQYNEPTFRANRLPIIIGLENLSWHHYEYYMDNDQIRFRTIEDKKDVDIFYFLNNMVDENPPFRYD